MMKRFGIGFGLFLILFAIVGIIDHYFPALGLFQSIEVNFPLFSLYAALGVIALLISTKKSASLPSYFKLSGIFFALLAATGFFNGKRPLFHCLSCNYSNTVNHFALACFALIAGFYLKTERKRKE